MEMSGNINNLDGDAAIRYAQETERIRAARAKRRWITVAIIIGSLFVLMVGCGVAVGAAASGGSSSSTSTAPTAAASASAAPTPTTDTGTPTEPAQSYSAPAASTELPRTWIMNGDWHVGDEVEAGTYRSDGPQTGVPVVLASVTVRNADGHVADVRTSTDGPIRITVSDGQTVSVVGALPFTKVGS
jgi:hypothetical protein